MTTTTATDAGSRTAPTVADYLRAVQAGQAPPPPSALLLDVRIADVGDGTAVFSLRPRPELDNGAGAVHGGFLASLADFAVASAVHDVPLTSTVVTAQLSITYTQPVPVSAGEVRARAVVLHRTDRTATVGVTVTGDEGRVHAVGTATCVISHARPETTSAP